MAIPPDLRELSDLFGASGEELYIVGGAVRDTLLGKTPKDYDLATGASLDAVMDIVSRDPENKTDLTGKAFGVVRVWTPTGNEYEIATFRKDIGTGRRPDVELGATIEDDVQRRDLTVNALFYDMDTGEVVDYVGGLADIQDKRIRAVGDPVERFAEDKLRILRAVRFAARLGSDLDIETKSAILDDNELTEVSPDRIHDEVSKGVASAQDVARYFELLESLELYDQLFPGLMISPSTGSNSSSLPVQLALLLVGNDPGQVRSVLRGMRYTNVETNTIDFLLKFVDIDQGTAPDIKRGFGRLELDPGDLRDFGAAAGMNPRAIDAFLRFAAAPPAVAAKDLMARGLRGPEVGQAMEDAEGEAYQSMLGELREYIRALLTEAARQPEDLPEDVKVVIEDQPGYVTIYYAYDVPGDLNGRLTRRGSHVPWGEVAIVNIQLNRALGPCDMAWKITGSEAKAGWGPLLYDVAMEVATIKGNGLMADRDSVSPSAHKVWDHYLANRFDVQNHQLDNLSDELTPTIEVDNCDQEVSERDEFVYPWHASPLSKRYTKAPTQIEKLRAMGKLEEEDFRR
jgi:hypothetical protein